jgi:DNA-binding MarR family transcriptional regulator
VARRAETLEAINDLLASATIFTSTSSELLGAELEGLAGDRLTFTQLKLLRLVARQDPLTIGDVAAFLGISNAAASKSVDRLVRGGFLCRAEARADRRATEVSLSEEGRALLDDFEARSSAALLRLLSGVTPRQMRDISGGLDRLSLSICGPIESGSSLCFRCGLYFRDECLLRTMTDRQCYMHLGSRRRAGEKPMATNRGGAGRRQVGVTTGGGG